MKLKKIFLTFMVIFFMMALFYIGLPDGQLQAASKDPGASGTILLDPAPDKDGKVKILLYYDMEGVSGQNDNSYYRSTAGCSPGKVEFIGRGAGNKL